MSSNRQTNKVCAGHVLMNPFLLLFFPFPCNSWWGKAMGKAGSKVLREASVDGIQAQVQACRHANKSRLTHTHTHSNVCSTSAETHTQNLFIR